ncbi:hypothetical protein KCP73_03055 [Salmonella enterica subsp. enterica]|nr:hypothetical protein KCP73_03055 [Salmonella enterica subsp. enterica]
MYKSLCATAYGILKQCSSEPHPASGGRLSLCQNCFAKQELRYIRALSEPRKRAKMPGSGHTPHAAYTWKRCACWCRVRSSMGIGAARHPARHGTHELDASRDGNTL